MTLFRRARPGHDVALCSVVEQGLVETIDKADRFRDQPTQRFEAQLLVIVFRHFGACQTCRYTTRKITRNLYLLGKRKHVRKQPSLRR
jgi:hypothetical protein